MYSALTTLGKALLISAITAACITAGGQYGERMASVSKKGDSQNYIRRAVTHVYTAPVNVAN